MADSGSTLSLAPVLQTFRHVSNFTHTSRLLHMKLIQCVYVLRTGALLFINVETMEQN